MVRSHFRKVLALCAASTLALCATTAAAQQSAARHFDIPAQALGEALVAFSAQADTPLIVPDALVKGKRAPAIQGQMPATEALQRLLSGSGLKMSIGTGGTIMIVRDGEPRRTTAALQETGRVTMAQAQLPEQSVASDPADSATAAEDREDGAARGGELRSDGAIAEILVEGRRTQNVDIRRTEDDPQPYVVFDRKEIEQSQAASLEEFFRTRLPMNATSRTNSQNSLGVSSSNVSSINLRGLGANQTLILVDGRRQPRVQALGGGDFLQADINGIPLAAIERIEVLPATAGGIYGGGAVGGVINIIRRRDYHGLSVQASYAGTFRVGGENFKIDLAGGFSLEGGKTQVSFSASHSASAPLYVKDRSFWRRVRARQVANDPSFFANPVAGYTTNIRSLTGAPLALDDGRVLGSAITHVPVGYAGTASDGGTALIAAAGQYNLELADNVTLDGGRKAPLLNGPRVRSANLNLRRSFGSALEGFVDLTISDNLGRSLYGRTLSTMIAADAPGNPFQQAVRVNVPMPGQYRPARNRSQTLSGTGGLIARLGSGWVATAEYGWSRSRSKQIYTDVFDSDAVSAAVASGTIDIFRDINAYPLDLSSYLYPSPNNFNGPIDTVQQLVSGRLSGGLLDLPGGTLSLTALVEHRREDAKVIYARWTDGTTVYPARSQSVDSGYVELRAPVISEISGIPLVRELEFQVSLRYDHYRTRTASPTNAGFANGVSVVLPNWEYGTARLSSTDYTVGLRWAPVQDISFRASYGTGFLPPSISQLTPTEFFRTPALAFYTDPLRGNRLVGSEGGYLDVFGGNPDLEPELSKSLSLGLILTPHFVPGFRLSVDYSRIRKKGEIGAPTADLLLENTDLFPGRVERGANLPSDLAGWSGPVTRLDTTLTNLARSRIQSIDFQADYDLETSRLGSFRVYGVATWMIERWQQLLPTVPGYDRVGYTGSFQDPLKWRGNAGINWSFGPWELAWNAQYYHSYSIRHYDPALAAISNRNVLIQGAERIPSQIYHDLAVQYRFGSRAAGRASLLSNVDVRFGIQNIFDKYPPVDIRSGTGYSTHGDPRLRRFTLSVRKSLGG